jgi:hypothetical protein
MKRIVAMLIAATLLGGCATTSAPRDEIAHTPVSSEAPQGMRCEDTKLIVVDGLLKVEGRVRRIYRWYPVGNFHVDVEFLDAQRERLALKSARLVFQPTRFGPPFPARFSVDVHEWPPGTTEIFVRTHARYKHQ